MAALSLIDVQSVGIVKPITDLMRPLLLSCIPRDELVSDSSNSFS